MATPTMGTLKEALFTSNSDAAFLSGAGGHSGGGVGVRAGGDSLLVPELHIRPRQIFKALTPAATC